MIALTLAAVLFHGAAVLPPQGTGPGWVATPARTTVGDTVRLARHIPIPSGAIVRPDAYPSDDRVLALAAPSVTLDPTGATITYVIAPFATGRIALAMPSTTVIAPDGSSATVLGDTAAVAVASVLPDTGRPAPRASLGPLRTPRSRPLALALAIVAVIIGAAAWAWWRNHRRGPRPVIDAESEPPPPPIDRWLAAGEARAVAAHAAARLRGGLARLVPAASRALATEECLSVLAVERPAWPLRELAELLHALDRARFAPLVPPDAADLSERADEFMAWLEAPSPIEQAS